MTLDLKEISKDYYFLVNRPDMLERAKELGYEHPILVNGELDEDDIRYLQGSGKAVLFYFYDADYDIEELPGLPASHWIEKVVKQISQADISRRFVAAQCSDIRAENDQDELAIKTAEDNIRYFPTVKETDKYMADKGLIWSTDYENLCGNCREYLEEGEKYCSRCGTKRGEGKFAPYRNEMYAVYGPVMVGFYSCKHCGHKWTKSRLGGTYARYCPECGSSEICKEKEDLDEAWKRTMRD